MERVQFDIDGMSCGHCVASVKRALAAQAGVTMEAVSVGHAELSYDPATTNPARIAQGIADEGYQVRVVPAD